MVSAGLRPSWLELNNALGRCSLRIKWHAFTMIHSELSGMRVGPRNLRQISIHLSFVSMIVFKFIMKHYEF
jgi:hypothetical protein